MDQSPPQSEPRPGRRPPSKPRWPVRAYLGWLVAACLLPGIVGTVFLIFHEYRDAREHVEKDNILTARALVQAVDAHLLKARIAAQSLATAGSLAKRHFADFHLRSKELLAATIPGSNAVLSDSSGQQIVNTLKTYGQPLPKHGNPAVLRQVFETGQPVISDLFIGGVTQRPIVSIDVPVPIDGEIGYVLSIGIEPEEFAGILLSQRLPEDWVAAIFDSEGTIVARTRNAEQFVGQKGSANYIRRFKEASEGAVENVTREGIPVFSVFSRSPVTGWTVGIGIPRQSLEARLQHKLLILMLSTLAIMGFGIVPAWLIGQRIATSIRALRGPATALGAGEPLPAPRVHVREAAEVLGAMGEAADLLEHRTASLQSTYHALLARENELLESETRFRAAFDQAAVGMARVSLEGKWLDVNDKLCEIVGYPRQALMESSFQEITYPPDLDADIALLQQLAAGSIPSYGLEKRYVRRDGSLVWGHLTVALVRTAEGKPDYFVSVIEDIEAKKQAEFGLDEAQRLYRQHLKQQVAEQTEALRAANRELERLAHQDALTKLPNRLAANERLRFEFLRLKRQGSPYCVLMMDIDHFKRINDTYGHETGDHVLTHFADTLAGTLRATDFVARYGGEEFLALVPDTELEGALVIAEKIRNAVGQQDFPVVGQVTLSIGVGLVQADDASEDAAVRRADAALYRSKNEGRNTVRT